MYALSAAEFGHLLSGSLLSCWAWLNKSENVHSLFQGAQTMPSIRAGEIFMCITGFIRTTTVYTRVQLRAKNTRHKGLCKLACGTCRTVKSEENVQRNESPSDSARIQPSCLPQAPTKNASSQLKPACTSSATVWARRGNHAPTCIFVLILGRQERRARSYRFARHE